MKKDTRIVIRASAELRQRLQKASENVGLSETILAEACVEALVRYIEENGSITMPLEVKPKQMNRAKVDYRQASRGAVDDDNLLAENPPTLPSKRRSA